MPNLHTDQYQQDGEHMFAIEHPDQFDEWMSMSADHIMEIRQ